MEPKDIVIMVLFAVCFLILIVDLIVSIVRDIKRNKKIDEGIEDRNLILFDIANTMDSINENIDKINFSNRIYFAETHKDSDLNKVYADYKSKLNSEINKRKGDNNNG